MDGHMHIEEKTEYREVTKTMQKLETRLEVGERTREKVTD